MREKTELEEYQEFVAKTTNELSEEQIMEMVGNVMFLLATICNFYDLTMDECLEDHIAKLAANAYKGDEDD